MHWHFLLETKRTPKSRYGLCKIIGPVTSSPPVYLWEKLAFTPLDVVTYLFTGIMYVGWRLDLCSYVPAILVEMFCLVYCSCVGTTLLRV